MNVDGLSIWRIYALDWNLVCDDCRAVAVLKNFCLDEQVIPDFLRAEQVDFQGVGVDLLEAESEGELLIVWLYMIVLTYSQITFKTTPKETHC